jgi:predicted site-specific integrase-resolvase
MKLSEWARQNDISYNTAHSWFKKGILPCESKQLPTGTIIVYPDKEINDDTKKNVVLYARVSSHDQKDDLKRQMERLKDYASAKGYTVTDQVTEIASGLNSNRPKLNKLLADQSMNTIIVEHRDRLTRFGFELIQSTLSSNNRNIVVINETEQDMDLVQDFIDVVTSMCARIYGKRSAKNKASKALKAMEEDQ